MRAALTPLGARCHCKLTLCAGQWIKVYNSDKSRDCMRFRIRIQDRRLEGLIYRCAWLLWILRRKRLRIGYGLVGFFRPGHIEQRYDCRLCGRSEPEIPCKPKK